jgi:hypothetical protein
VRDRLADFGDATVALVLFAPPTELARYRAHFDLPFPVLSDEPLRWYRYFGFGRGSYRAVYGVGTLRMYGRLLRSGRRLQRPTQDVRQLGGDLVLGRDGRVAHVFRPGSPDARPTVDELVRTVSTC